MTDEDANFLRQQLLDVWRQVHEIRTSQEALLRTFVESLPNPADGVRLLDKYDAHKAAFSEEVLLKLEKSSPGFAAELDKLRPLLPPDGKSR
jgi:hypothetical protein